MTQRRSAGLTILELLITVALIMIMVGFASFNYMKIVDEQKLGKAQNECREFVKALKAWENKKGVPVRQWVSAIGQPTVICPSCGRLVETALTCRYDGKPLPVRLFKLDDLTTENIVKTLPDDPWSVGYSIDTTRGYVYSFGPDMLDHTGDDVKVPFRPPFEILRARQDAVANQVVVEFSRPVDRSSITSASLPLSSGGPVDITTYALDLADPYHTKVFLSKKWAPNTNFLVTVTKDIKARDGTPIDLSRTSVVSTNSTT